MPNEINDFSVCGETWYGITQAHDILEHLETTRRWLEAGGNLDQDVRSLLNLASANAGELTQQLIDLQIKLLTIL